ncbi:MAG TPA: cytochrome c1, partial [Albitalea sp.]
MKKFLLSLLMALGVAGGAVAAEGGIPLDRFPVEKMSDVAALQNGAKLFVNYCLNCHSAAFMRYNRMRDLDLTEEQIRKNMLFTSDKVGEVMKVAFDPRQAKEWFGSVPPDLSVIARSRASHSGTGPDYLYTYLRTYYKDETKPTGW